MKNSQTTLFKLLCQTPLIVSNPKSLAKKKKNPQHSWKNLTATPIRIKSPNWKTLLLNCSLLSPSSRYLQNLYLCRSFCLPKGCFITALWGRLAFALSIGVATFIYIYIFDKKPLLLFDSLSITKFSPFLNLRPPIFIQSLLRFHQSSPVTAFSHQFATLTESASPLSFFSLIYKQNPITSLSLISQTKPFE